MKPAAFLKDLLDQSKSELDQLSDVDKEIITKVLSSYAEHHFQSFIRGPEYLDRNALHFQAQVDSLESRMRRIITKSITNTTIKFARQAGMFAIKASLGLPVV